jgi:DNA/RNA endonuclease YhcR with UshA esterase domain
VITTGVVAVLPGVFGTQYLYMVDSMNTASSSETPGVQVYLFNKDFPKLSLGDRIEVTGELSEISGELRLKAKEKSDIRVLGGEHVPAPSVFDIGDTGEAVEGWLIEVSGEVTELKSTHMYVDDGTDEIKVYFKKGTGIDKKMFHIGDIVRVVGIMSQTKTGYQLLPRDQFDIIKTGVSDAFVVSVESSERTEDGQVAETYLTATAGGITSLLVGLFAKMHGSTAMKYSKRVAGIAAVYIKNKRA